MQYTPPPHVTQYWQLSKPSAKGRRGMVVSQAKGAAEAGVAVLDADIRVAHSAAEREEFVRLQQIRAFLLAFG